MHIQFDTLVTIEDCPTFRMQSNIENPTISDRTGRYKCIHDGMAVIHLSDGKPVKMKFCRLYVNGVGRVSANDTADASCRGDVINVREYY